MGFRELEDVFKSKKTGLLSFFLSCAQLQLASEACTFFTLGRGHLVVEKGGKSAGSRKVVVRQSLGNF